MWPADVSHALHGVYTFFKKKVNSFPTCFRKSENWGEEKKKNPKILASLEKLADPAVLIPVQKLLAGGKEQLLPQSPLLPIASLAKMHMSVAVLKIVDIYSLVSVKSRKVKARLREPHTSGRADDKPFVHPWLISPVLHLVRLPQAGVCVAAAPQVASSFAPAPSPGFYLSCSFPS